MARAMARALARAMARAMARARAAEPTLGWLKWIPEFLK